MQKLEGRDTYAPTDAPQVCSNCDSVIKHGQCDQVLRNLKTPSNSSDVDLLQHRGGSDLRVQNIVYAFLFSIGFQFLSHQNGILEGVSLED